MLTRSTLAFTASTNERKIKLLNLCNEYLESVSSSSATTIDYYLKDFLKFVSNKYVTDITVDDIQKYINYKKSNNLKDTTIYRCYRILKTLFNYAVSHEYLSANVCENVKVKHAKSSMHDIDYSKKYIKRLLKLFKHTDLYYVVLVAVHARYA